MHSKVSLMPTRNDDLLEWAMKFIAREQASGIYGSVTVYLEKGVITRVERVRTELPHRPSYPLLDSASDVR